MSLADPPITVVEKKTGTAGVITATYNFGEGEYELLDARVSVPIAYAQKAIIGYYCKRGDGTTDTHELKTGWCFNYNNLTIDSARRIIGPGQLFGLVRCDSATTVTLLALLRRLRP